MYHDLISSFRQCSVKKHDFSVMERRWERRLMRSGDADLLNPHPFVEQQSRTAGPSPAERRAVALQLDLEG